MCMQVGGLLVKGAHFAYLRSAGIMGASTFVELIDECRIPITIDTTSSKSSNPSDHDDNQPVFENDHDMDNHFYDIIKQQRQLYVSPGSDSTTTITPNNNNPATNNNQSKVTVVPRVPTLTLSIAGLVRSGRYYNMGKVLQTYPLIDRLVIDGRRWGGSIIMSQGRGVNGEEEEDRSYNEEVLEAQIVLMGLSRLPNILSIAFTHLSHVTSIPGFFLGFCTQLTTIDMATFTNVASIGSSFLIGCSSITVSIVDDENTTTTTHTDIIHSTSTAINCTPASMNSIITVEMGRNIQCVPESFMEGCTALEDSEILVNMTEIEAVLGSFLKECISLKTINLTNLWRLQKSPEKFLSDCCGLQSVNLEPMYRLRIIDGCFMKNCIGLEQLDLTPLRNIEVIMTEFLSGCENLKSLDFSSMTKIRVVHAKFLLGCRSLVSLDISSFTNISDILAGFLEGCSSLTTIDTSSLTNILSISDNFMASCSSLSHLDCRPFTKVKRIGRGFLSNCVQLSTINLCGLSLVNHINSNFLEGCVSLTSIDLAPLSKLTAIPANFLSGSGITSIDLTSLRGRVVVVHEGFLKGCRQLKEVDVEPLSGVPILGGKLCEGCGFEAVLPSRQNNNTGGDEEADELNALFDF